MTYLAACSIATLLLAVFVIVSIWTHLARNVQERRARKVILDAREATEELRLMLAEAQDLSDVNAAAERLNETMRRTIGEGIDLARVLDAGNGRFAELVAARQAQREQEDSTLLQWAKIRDDLESFYASYPPYLFANGGQG